MGDSGSVETQNGAESVQTHQSQAISEEQSQDDHPPPSKRAKRGKYTAKACGECQRRKIKCDGNSPCKTCLAKGYECQRQSTDGRGKWRDSKATLASPRNLASRLSQIEHRLGLNPSEIAEHRSPEYDPRAPRHSNPGGSPPNKDPTPQVPSFSGETSIAHNLTVVEDRFEQMGVRYAGIKSPPPSHAFSRSTASPEAPIDRPSVASQANPVRRVLHAHGIVPKREQWDGLMRTFCDEVHIVVPFLHLPTLWDLYKEFWDRFSDTQASEFETIGVRRVQAAHVLLCLANGRCVESSQFEGDQGPYSAGRSLYSAARDIFGDLLEGFQQCGDQLLVLQTVVLMVVYLFRLDAHGSAEKLLALSISHAHHLGLQRKRVIDKMSPFESEMFRRLWWCIYLLDRRLAIETGRPFLIQDVNVDVGLPRNVSDEWLKSQDATHEVNTSQPNTATGPTAVPYLIAMVHYSRVIGKVWEALYGAATSESTPSPLLHEYLEHLIDQSQKGIPREFTYDSGRLPAHGGKGLAWWQVKQQVMMRIRWSSLYLLIRKPMLHRKCSPDWPLPEAIENEVTCMHLAQKVFDDFSQVPEEHPKYTFPFLHYLVSAAIISLGLILKQPSFRRTYGALTLSVVRSLKEHCRKTWVSRKMIQTVWRLNQMADAILSSGDTSNQNTSTGETGAFLRDGQTGHSSASRSRTTMLGPQSMPVLNHASDARVFSDAGNSESVALDCFEDSFAVPHALSYTDRDSHRETKQGRGYVDVHSGTRNSGHSTGCNISSSLSRHQGPLEIDESNNVPEEMIDGGMEWLQGLFANGLDTNLPSVWD